MGDVGVEDETIAVGDEVKKHYNQPQGRRRGGERYSNGEGIST